MTKSQTQFYLHVKTDQYTGNWDSFLSGLLFCYDDDRYGWEKGAEQHIGFPADEIELIPHPEAKYDLPYKVLFESDSNTLEFALDGPLSDGQQRHLSNSYTGKSFTLNEGAITILGFSAIMKKVVTETVSIDF